MVSAFRSLRQRFSVKLLLAVVAVCLVLHHFLADVWFTPTIQTREVDKTATQKDLTQVPNGNSGCGAGNCPETRDAGDAQNSASKNEESTQDTGPPSNSTNGKTLVGSNVTLGPPPEVRFPPNVLLLSSMGRSGSSFLGGLLTSPPNVFYVFEPLHLFEHWNTLSETTARTTFKEILSCDFSERVMKAVVQLPHFCFRSPKMPLFRGDENKYNLRREWVRNTCKRRPIRVIKTIRTEVAWLEPLLRDPETNLKVIHLVRDPRASIISAMKLKWTVKPKSVCERVREDLWSGRNLTKVLPGRYMAVRYEDICEDPYKMARDIFTFLGYENLPDSTVRYLKYSTSSNGGGSFGTHRNTSAQQLKWREKITSEELQAIEPACATVLDEIGFNVFGDIDNAKNLSFPLYSENKFFTYYEGR